MGNHFDPVDLKLLIRIAETQSFSAAARKSFLSLSAVSTRIRNLEMQLKTILVNRTIHGAELTSAGRILFEHAKSVIAADESMKVQLCAYASGAKGHIRVSATTVAMIELLPAAIHRFSVKHPGVSIVIQELFNEQVLDSVINGLVDVGVAVPSLETPVLDVAPFSQDRLVIVAGRGHPVALRPAVRFSELLDFDFVRLAADSAMYEFLSVEANALRRSLNTTAQVGSFDAVCRIVAATASIAIVPRSAAERYARPLDLPILNLEEQWAHLNHAAVTKIDMPLVGLGRDFVNELITLPADSSSLAGVDAGRSA